MNASTFLCIETSRPMYKLTKIFQSSFYVLRLQQVAPSYSVLVDELCLSQWVAHFFEFRSGDGSPPGGTESTYFPLSRWCPMQSCLRDSHNMSNPSHSLVFYFTVFLLLLFWCRCLLRVLFDQQILFIFLRQLLWIPQLSSYRFQ